MLRELIAWVLNNYLGKYVENLNTAQLTVALLSGEVELENLPLRRDALQSLGLPLEALSGVIGKIKLQVPVRQFRTAPWCIFIENIYIVVGPTNLNEWDNEKEEQIELDYKLSKLHRNEAQWRAEKETSTESSYYASSYTGWLNYGTSLITNVMENLQLKINDVHIRYEDTITVLNHRFACGITIDSLSAQSCDSNWLSGYTTNWNNNTASFKLIELQSFSFYWDLLNNDETFGNIESSELVNAIQSNNSKWSHQYIINPVSAQAQLKRDRCETPLRTRSRPRLVCDLTLNEILLNVCDWQYNQMAECTKQLEEISKYKKYRLLRPNKTVKDNPKLWWLYALKCHGIKYSSKIYKFNIAKENIKYINIYKKVLFNPNEPLSIDDKELKDKVEKFRTYDELKLLQEICMRQLPIINTKNNSANQGRSVLLQWFPQWWGWYNNTTTTTNNEIIQENVDGQEIKEQIQLEDELLNALSDTVENNSLLKRDTVFGKFNFTLSEGTLNLCTGSPGDKNSLMIQLQFENLILDIESRPRSDSYFIGLSLGSMYLKDRITVNTEFPDLLKPQTKDDNSSLFQSQKSRIGSLFSLNSTVINDPLFELHYERRPLSYHADYRLYIRSKSLDIVYNMDAIKWLFDFFLKPYQIINTKKKIEVMKHKTKMELFKNWENILEGDLTKRKVWALEIDISAPRIIFAENLSDLNGSIILIDFGRFQLTNDCDKKELKNNQNQNNSDNVDYDSENDDEFMTPCSTPPGSKASTDDSITLCTALSELAESSSVNTLNECLLKNKFYDHFNLNLTDLQILICKAKEKWSFASAKGTSSLHILDRFNIALEIDRRIIPTTDPQYPNLTLSGTLPKLVAHINEYKIGTIVTILNILSKKSYYSSPTTDDNCFINDNVENTILTNNDEELIKDASKQIILQFAIDQIALEVQSRSRSVAELQVTGVKVGFSKRSVDTNITLSVHSLLLVDAIQSFGPDFELLIASHRHVGMDSVSGSLKQSEPCSPISPGSPDPSQDYRRPTSPHTISRALSSLQRATSLNNSTSGDLDALITVEILFVTPEKEDEKLQIANIQFNNLDIIANQETIVELIGFAKRVMPRKRKSISSKEKFVEGLNQQSLDENTNVSTIKTEIQFDFHRLNVLVLRAIMRDNYLVGRKVGTFTMSEARINATLGSSITVEGSLGGLQVLNLTPEGVNHQRILSVGKDPLTEPQSMVHDLLHSLSQEVYAMGQNKINQHSYDELKQALSFSVTRNLSAHVDIKIRMASVWYTHCARFMQELNWCATEFKHYLKNLAKSIRDKATDMALGLVQPRYEMTKPVTQSFEYDSPRQSAFPIISTPTSNKLFLPKGPTKPIDIRLDIVLQTPVLVIPRSSSSSQVLVAHLGKISINNYQEYNDLKDIENKIFTINEDYDIIDDITNLNDSTVNNYDTYMIDIRNMNMFSLDTNNRKGFRFSALPRAEEFYSCDQDAVAILHDTAVQLKITRITEKSMNIFPDINLNNLKNLIQINGSVVTPLQLSLSRQQYEQLLETVENIFKIPTDIVRPPTDIQMKQQQHSKDIDEIKQNDLFEVNNKFKKNLFPNASVDTSNFLEIKTSFDLPNFIIQLKNDTNNPLIEISFRDFNVNYDKSSQYETNIQVSLRSVQMEDLLRPVESKHRIMVISSSPKSNITKPQNAFVSTSCPNLCRLPNDELNITGSLPENLESEIDYLMSQCNNNTGNYNHNHKTSNNKTMCPDTPPPSPQRKRQDNLVLYSSLIVDPDCPTFETQYKSIRQSSSIDFNCLDLIISLDSWFILLNFFGLLSDDIDEKLENKVVEAPKDMELNVGYSEMEISVRSLTVVLTKTNYDIAKANVSKAYFMISKHGVTKTVEGKLGSISLIDLTTHGTLYREKFLTSGNEALSFIYLREKVHSNVRSLTEDSKLKIQMSTVRLVYTKRFITEIQDFFKKFSQLQTPVMRKIKSSESQNQFGAQKPIQINLEINAESPIILLPMSSKSDKLLYADFGKFSIKNSFHFTNEINIISKKTDINQIDDLIIDKIFANLINTDIYTGIRLNYSDNLNNTIDNYLNMGSYIVIKKDKSLLKHKCQLKLQIERNMDTWKSHNVPDISVQGTLSRLEIVLNLQDYMLIRGFLSYNIGEPLDDLYIDQMNLDFDQNDGLNDEQKNQQNQVWANTSITLDLQDVSLRLEIPNNLDIEQIKDLNYYLLEKSINNLNNNNILLACINFIKSSLKIDTFSDGTQDIDLVSQEIIVKDTRFIDNNINEQMNVFTNILQSINNYNNNLNKIVINDDTQQTSTVQAEIHARKRHDITKYTILLNNMRLMVILDWLEIIRDFLQQSDECITTNLVQKVIINDTNNQQENPIEVILFITDTEFVFVEKTNQLDTNAIILKSTTVISYRPSNLDKVMSINLNNLEVFSCILGSEEATALSIIDPVTIHLDIKQGVLDVQLEKQLCIRLSYSDMKLFLQMLESLPKQRKTPVNRNISVHSKSLNKLSALGFKQNDCEKALTICNQQLDEAALWLTQNAEPLKHFQQTTDKALYIYAIEIHANCISICVIDDCRDADVPFLEISLSQLDLRQELDVPPDVNRLNELAMIDHSGLSPSGCVRTGHLKAIFGSDYYNRALSGWEPLIEPWKCESYWDYSISPRELQANRLHINFLSDDQLKLNITSDVLNLFKLVHDNWIQDYYGNNNLNQQNPVNQSYRRRTPFIPFALKNETGVKLWFTTLVSSPGGISRNEMLSEYKSENSKSTWKSVESGEVISFSFDLPNKQRHQDSHKLNLHQIRVRIDGWDEVGPVAVDKVGTYFRHTLYETISQFSQLRRARIVFAVTLEGSARKLITVRSALQVSNRLDCPILLKMEHVFGHLNIMTWPDTKTTIINSNEIYNVPLSHVHSFLYVRPHNINYENSKLVQANSNDKNKMNGNDYWTKYDCYNNNNNNKSNLLKQTSTTTSSTTILNGNHYQYCDKSIHWKDGNDTNVINTDMRTCKSNNNKNFRIFITIKRNNYPINETNLLPGHIISLWPPLRLVNLLPCDLLYCLPSDIQGRVLTTETANIYDIDFDDQSSQLIIAIDNYPGKGIIKIPCGYNSSMDLRLKLTDTNNRILNLIATLQFDKGSGLQIFISSPFWLVNRTGLPLIFRQEGVATESSGQFTENEQARLVSPLMFSYADPDAPPTLICRLGKRYGSNPPCCQPFNLDKDLSYRQLKSGNTNETFVIGIEIQRGRGLYAKTTTVIFSPRFQLYNRSSHKLQFTQKYFTTIMTDKSGQLTYMEAIPGCHIPFHWPRLDKEQEICIRLPDVQDCLWSGSVPIQETQSLYINIRNTNGDMHFLRLEIILQGATYYLLFGDAQTLPPPIRIDNYSEVPMKFYQPDCRNQWRTIVKPHSSIAYALDEPMGSQSLQIEAPGGVTHLYNFKDLGMSYNLTYENFIYIAFTGTFKLMQDNNKKNIDIEQQQLVLGVINNRVVLTRKQTGDRSQLWRMNQDKQLEHEGSSPPVEPGKKPINSLRYVLDIEKPPQPMNYTNLVVRPANKQRKSTQTWHFTEEGRLMCEHSNMCVQARGGFFGLRPGSDAVLGMTTSETHMITKNLIPIEQAIERQKLRPGSGCISVSVNMDGPIKTIQVKDIKYLTNKVLAIDPKWKHVSHMSSQQNDVELNSSNSTEKLNHRKFIGEYHIVTKIKRGLGISLVSRNPSEELAFITLESILMETIITKHIRAIDLSIGDMQIDNQLFETPCSVMLYTIKTEHNENNTSSSNSTRTKLSALQLNVKMLPSPNENAIIFEHFILSLRPIAINIEERLLLRLVDFFGLVKIQYNQNNTKNLLLIDNDNYIDEQQIITNILSSNVKRYYFGDLQLIPSQIRLSVLTASKLTTYLSAIKKCLGLTLIKFEDAIIDFEKFVDKHHFETLDVYTNAIKNHYKKELKWQAGSILGSVDFLGNPLGLANDLSEGVSGLLFEGSVTSLLKNVTHGISNSTAKLTETLSHGLGKVVLDEQDTETRQKILQVPDGTNTTSDHLMAGLKGFGFGLLGGVTSIVKHTYSGAQSDGLHGLLSGLGLGLIGTVTKPVIGVLDLASETANAVKETSKSSNRLLPERKRLPRCVISAPSNLLPQYSFKQSKGQQHLFIINKRNYTEQFMAYEPHLFDVKNSKLRLLVSNEHVWIFSLTEDSTTIVLSYHLSEMVSCHAVSVNSYHCNNNNNNNDVNNTIALVGSSRQQQQQQQQMQQQSERNSKKINHYIELCLMLNSSNKSLQNSEQEVVKRPRVRCQTEEMAQKASYHINYAKGIYDQRKQTLNFDSVME